MRKINLIDNRYLLIKEVGIGGFATVYRAWDSTLQKFVAIKKIHEEYSHDAKFADMFRAEALNTAKLEHENIVRVINFIKDSSGNLYMIMDYVNGVNLAYFIKKCRDGRVKIPYEFVLYVFSEILKALDYGQSVKDDLSGQPLNIVHRDISPPNIMLYFDGRIKLTDFGIAKAGDTQPKSTKKRKIGGKIAYMSPEQAQGEATIDARSDLFSCGIIMYEMLTGDKAFEGDSDLDMLQKVKSVNCDFSKLKKVQISREIQDIIKKIMQKSPDKRFQNAVEMFIEIKKELSKIATTYEIRKKYAYFVDGFLKTERERAAKERDEDLRAVFQKAAGHLVEEEYVEEEAVEVKEAQEKRIKKETLEEQKKSKDARSTEEVKEIKEAKKAKEVIKAEESGKAEEAGQAEEAQKAKEFRMIEETKKAEKVIKAEEFGKAEEAGQAEEVQKAKEFHMIEEAKKAEKAIKADQSGKAEDASRIEEAKKADETKKAEERLRLKETKKTDIKLTEKKTIERSLDQIPRPLAEERGGILKTPPEEQLGGEKTIFDFVLDTAKKHMKIFISATVSIFLAFIIYSAVDTYTQLTGWGVKIHNLIWPPALKINTIPSGAHIKLMRDDVDIILKEGYQTLTPSYIKEIQPGTYTLKLNKENYKEIIRKVTVYGEFDDDKSISIARAKIVNGVYVIPFEVVLEVNSIPSGSDLYLDDVKIGETPFTVSLEIGKNSLRLEKEGFEPLGEGKLGGTGIGGICELDTALPSDKQSRIDTRYWEVREMIVPGEGRKFIIKGTHWKNFVIKSKPSGAAVYIDNSANSVGETPVEKLPLTAGTKHVISIKKEGFESWSKNIEVRADSERDITATLKKFIRISAYRIGKPKKDIGAEVTIKNAKVKRKTPFSIALPVKEYSFIFKKEPAYKIVTFKKDIETADPNISVGMVLRPPYIKVNVKVDKTGKGVGSARLWIDGVYWKRTDKKGIAAGYISRSSGEARIEVRTGEYEDYTSSLYLEKAKREYLEVRLGIPNDCIILVDASEDFQNSSIYIDGEHVGNRYKWIYDVTRSRHIIEVKADELRRRAKKKLIITKPEDIRLLKLVREGAKGYLKEFDFAKEKIIKGAEIIKFKDEIKKVLETAPDHSGAKRLLEDINKRMVEFRQRADKLMVKANELYLEGRYEEVLEYYKEVLDIDKDNPEARFKLYEAQQYVEGIREQEKEKELRKKEEKLEKKIAKYYRRGVEDFDNREYEQALIEFEKGVALISDGENKVWKEKLREEIYETRIQLSEQHYLNGYAYLQDNMFNKAKSEFKEALSFNPFNDKARNKLDEVRERTIQINIREARRLYQKGVDDNDIKSIQEAIKNYQELLIVDSDNISIRHKIKDAERKITEIRAIHTEREQTAREKEIENKVSRFYERGIEKYESERYKEALSNFRSGLKVAKNWDNEKWKEKLVKKIEDTKVRIAEYHYENGYSYYQQNNLEEAKKEFKKAVSYNPSHNEARNKIKEIRKKIDLRNRNKAERLYSLGLDEYATGNDQEAVALWEKALKLNPRHKEASKALERIKEKIKAQKLK